MKFSLADTTESNSIQSYDESGITIATPPSATTQLTKNQRVENSVFICATQILTDFSVSSLAALSSADCQSIFALNKAINLDVLLIGCHDQASFLSAELYAQFIKQHIGVECMSVGAACRTYNMLLNESRSVGVLILI